MRPMPPGNLGQFESYTINIIPAYDMPLWVKQTFLDTNSKLFNNDHYHLLDCMDMQIVFLWAASGYEKQMQRVVGQTEQLTIRASAWQKMRQEQQFHEWFGQILPDFVITLDGQYCAQCSDLEFCALVEHQLFFIAQAVDEFGAPKFRRDNGLPVLCMKSPSVQEFVPVVERYGVPKDSDLEKIVKAGSLKPIVSAFNIAAACGTTLLKKVA